MAQSELHPSHGRAFRHCMYKRAEVHSHAADGEDRVVHISAMEEDRNAGAAQEALLRCCTCLTPDPLATCGLRLIVPSPQVEYCLSDWRPDSVNHGSVIVSSCKDGGWLLQQAHHAARPLEQQAASRCAL